MNFLSIKEVQNEPDRNINISKSTLFDFFLGCNSNVEDKTVPDAESKTAATIESKATKSHDTSKHIGHYENDMGTLNIHKNGTFNIETATAKGCTGEVSGPLKFRNNTSAIYDADACKLTFAFGAGNVTITEEKCKNQHGMACSFDGEYKIK